jgi:hypothetical protein
MMARRLPVQIVDDELVAGLLQVGSHPAAHGAQPDESHHLVLGHLFTVTAIYDSRPASYALAARPALRKASRPVAPSPLTS